VELYLSGPEANQRFEELVAKKSVIESQINEVLDWQPLPDAEACRIALTRTESPLDYEVCWGEYIDWMVERIVKFDSVFRPHRRHADGNG